MGVGPLPFELCDEIPPATLAVDMQLDLSLECIEPDIPVLTVSERTSFPRRD
jgi:hypothetical protein